MSRFSDHVHLMDGFLPAGRKVRAVCSCGYQTSPRVDERRALQALESEHGYTRPVCVLCGRDYEDRTWQQLRDMDLQVLTDPATGAEFIACRDAPPACREGAAQRQIH